MRYRILVINFGSTSTKLAVYEDMEIMLEKSILYSREELTGVAKMVEQLPLRKKGVLDFLSENSLKIGEFSAVVARAGVTPPLDAGAYIINETMVERLKTNPLLDHPSNMTPMVAFELTEGTDVLCIIYDSLFDQMEPVAKITGIPDIKRTHMGHVENMRAVAFKTAEKIGKKIDDCNFVITHLGGGITQSVMKKGRLIDFNDSSNSPFSPERAGIVPARQFAKLIYSGKYTEQEITKLITGRGGMYAHLGTADCREVEKRIAEGDEKAKLVYQAMAYQTAKGVGAFATVLGGEVDAVVFTGGVSRSEMFMGMVRKSVEFIAPIHIWPGEYEMESMAYGALRVLRGEEIAREYVNPD